MNPKRKLGSPVLQLIFLGAFVLVSRPCFADHIVAVKDSHGNIIFINTGTPEQDVSTFRALGRRRDTPQVKEINSVVDQVSKREDVDPKLVRSIISVESDYDPRAVSSKGAMGLMQLMPETAQDLGVTKPFDIRQNIQGGVSHLKYLLNLFGGDVRLSLAAYNAGEHAVEHSHGVPAIPETQNYVRKITRLYEPGKKFAGGKIGRRETPPAPIFTYVDAHGVVHFTNTQ